MTHFRRLAQISRHIGPICRETNAPVELSLHYVKMSFDTNKPSNYFDKYYWIKHMKQNQYAFGLKNDYIHEFGYPEILMLEVNVEDILMKGDIFGVMENDKSTVVLETPFDYALIRDVDEILCTEKIIDNPESINSRICVFENLGINTGCLEEVEYPKEYYSMPLL